MNAIALGFLAWPTLVQGSSFVQEGRSDDLAQLLLSISAAKSMQQSGTRNRVLSRNIAMDDSVSRRQAITEATVVAATLIPVGANAAEYPKIKIQTTAGDMEFDLWNDVAPKHVESFLKLTKDGFYDGGAFHRIIPGFVIQGGDPYAKKGYGPDGRLETGDQLAQMSWGTGGPGYSVPAEFNERPHEFGVLSMARSNDPNSAGSQFFVCLGRLKSLDNKYTVFGKLTKGEDVLKKLGDAKRAAGDKPVVRQGIEKVEAI